MKVQSNGCLIWRIHQIKEAKDKEALSCYLEEKMKEAKGKQLAVFEKHQGHTEQLCFEITGGKEANAHKVLRQLQKQLLEMCRALISVIENLEEVIQREENWLILTAPALPEENIRLKKLIDSIDETAYYDVYYLYGPDKKILKKYLSHRRIGMIDWADKCYLIDEQALCQKINLNCQACTSKYEFGCCCGSPCNYSKRNLKVYKAHEKEIVEELKRIEPDFYEAICSQLGEQTGSPWPELVGFDGAVGECSGRCMLLVREDGMAKCLAHKYALTHHIPIYEMSPLSCLMFPFEIIDCLTHKGKKLRLFTGVTEEETAEKIGRWGSYERLEIELSCIREKLSNERFKKEDYQSVYAVNKGLVSHEFGNGLYEALCLMLQEEK